MNLTTLERLHLEQIGQLLFRAGIELSVLGRSDLSDYVRRLYLLNRTSTHLDGIWRLGATEGSVLIYVYPNPSPEPDYCLKYFSPDQFEVECDSSGQVVSASICWSESSPPLYRRILLTSTEICEWSSSRPTSGEPDSRYTNLYGFVPAVLIANGCVLPGEPGVPEFESLRSELDGWAALEGDVASNVSLFSGPILYTSRSRSELQDAKVLRENADELSGFAPIRRREAIRLRSIVDNYDPETDVLGYLSPTPLPPQLFEYLTDRRRQLRASLGSVDESRLYNQQLVLRSPAELSLALSFATNTARKRARTYLTYGVVHAFELALRMAAADSRVNLSGVDTVPLVSWRYLGDIWEVSPAELLQSSIVARNLARLGISPMSVLAFLFPDKERTELEQMVEGGFPYEFLVGVADVGAKMEATGADSEFLKTYFSRASEAAFPNAPEPSKPNQLTEMYGN